MKVFRGLSQATSNRPCTPCALTIGNFDGVHRGHRALLAKVREAADRLNVTASVMTFEPHPREFFARLAGDSGKAPSRIATLRDNMNAMANAGMDSIIVEHFNATFAAQSPQEFIEKILIKGLNVKWLMVGDDFCFGAKRAGNITTLKEAGKHYGFTVEALPTVTTQEGQRISSSAVRAALALGDFAKTHELIGHSYTITGHIIHGKKIGRTIGYPTLNIRFGHQSPALSGVFAVQVHGLGIQPLPAVASLGVRPTVEDAGRVLLEAHIFDYDQSCYGQLVQVEFLHKIRDEAKFPDLASMITAIQEDEKKARAYFKTDFRASSANDRI